MDAFFARSFSFPFPPPMFSGTQRRSTLYYSWLLVKFCRHWQIIAELMIGESSDQIALCLTKLQCFSFCITCQDFLHARVSGLNFYLKDTGENLAFEYLAPGPNTPAPVPLFVLNQDVYQTIVFSGNELMSFPPLKCFLHLYFLRIKSLGSSWKSATFHHHLLSPYANVRHWQACFFPTVSTSRYSGVKSSHSCRGTLSYSCCYASRCTLSNDLVAVISLVLFST